MSFLEYKFQKFCNFDAETCKNVSKYDVKFEIALDFVRLDRSIWLFRLNFVLRGHISEKSPKQ